MIDLFTDFEVVSLSQEELIVSFDCGDSDLNDFFNNDAIHYQNQWLGRTYFFRHKLNRKIACAFSLSSDSIKTSFLPNSRRKKVHELIPYKKSLQSYPAFLIGRLGVDVNFSNQGIGSQLLEYIKTHCVTKYPFFGRFIVVDAYNDTPILNFYRKNDFSFVFSTESQEKENLKKTLDYTVPLKTRQMFYDIMRFANEIER
jgi:GNAT superfamily N-acetyltransferase